MTEMNSRYPKRPNCERHKTFISHFGEDFELLAKELGDLRYDALQDFLIELANKIDSDAEKDLNGDRNKLANRLFLAAQYVSSAAVNIGKAWTISEPFMNVSSKYSGYDLSLVGKPYAQENDPFNE